MSRDNRKVRAMRPAWGGHYARARQSPAPALYQWSGSSVRRGGRVRGKGSGASVPRQENNQEICLRPHVFSTFLSSTRFPSRH